MRDSIGYSPSGAIIPKGSDFTDSLDGTSLTIGQFSATRSNALGRLSLAVSGCKSLTVFVLSNVALGGVDCIVGVEIDGTWSTGLQPLAQGSLESFTIALDGKAHTVDLINGWNSGGTIVALVHSVAWQGGTVSINQNPRVAKRLVVYGDSISVGAVAAPIPRYGWVSRLRADYVGRISMQGWGGLQLWDEISGTAGSVGSIAGLVQRIVDLFFGSPARILWDAIGINDWAAGNWTAAQFGAALTTLYNAIHAIDPTVQIYSQTPIITGGGTEAYTNAKGEVPGAFRTAKAAASAGMSWVTVVDGTTLVTEADLGPGGIHPTTAGQAAMYTSIKAILQL